MAPAWKRLLPAETSQHVAGPCLLRLVGTTGCRTQKSHTASCATGCVARQKPPRPGVPFQQPRATDALFCRTGGSVLFSWSLWSQHSVCGFPAQLTRRTPPASEGSTLGCPREFPGWIQIVVPWPVCPKAQGEWEPPRWAQWASRSSASPRTPSWRPGRSTAVRS